MKNKIKRIAAVCLALLTVLLSACGRKTMENATFGEVRKSFNDDLNLSGPVLTENAVSKDFSPSTKPRMPLSTARQRK